MVSLAASNMGRNSVSSRELHVTGWGSLLPSLLYKKKGGVQTLHTRTWQRTHCSLPFSCAHRFTAFAVGLTNSLRLLCAAESSHHQTVRPLFLSRGVVLDELCQLCSVVQEAYKDRAQGAFALVMEEMLQDVRQRVVFRAQHYVARDIAGFQPQPVHLRYPELLAVSNQAGGDSKPYKGWYPTLTRSLQLLSKLYRCVEREVFQGLSQAIVHDCVRTLLAAAELVAKAAVSYDSAKRTRGWKVWCLPSLLHRSSCIHGVA